MRTLFQKQLVLSAMVIDIIIFDQLTKWYFAEYRPVHVLIPEWVRFMYVENRGIAFSIPLTGIPLQVITVILITLLFWAIRKYRVYEQPLLYFFVLCILGGALGNAIDRIFRGFVVDFISIGTFPVFNIADSFVTIGGVGLLSYLWWQERKNTL